jgi:hypothetical protein
MHDRRAGTSSTAPHLQGHLGTDPVAAPAARPLQPTAPARAPKPPSRAAGSGLPAALQCAGLPLARPAARALAIPGLPHPPGQTRPALPPTRPARPTQPPNPPPLNLPGQQPPNRPAPAVIDPAHPCLLGQARPGRPTRAMAGPCHPWSWSAGEPTAAPVRVLPTCVRAGRDRPKRHWLWSVDAGRDRRSVRLGLGRSENFIYIYI